MDKLTPINQHGSVNHCQCCFVWNHWRFVWQFHVIGNKPWTELTYVLYRIEALFILKALQVSSSVMFFPQEFGTTMACIALQFVMLCCLIKIYRAELQLGMNNQQELTEGRERSNRERINGIADLYIRHATEYDEREGWVNVFYSSNFCVKKTKECLRL